MGMMMKEWFTLKVDDLSEVEIIYLDSYVSPRSYPGVGKARYRDRDYPISSVAITEWREGRKKKWRLDSITLLEFRYPLQYEKVFT